MIWVGLGLTTMALSGLWFAPKISRHLFLDRKAQPELPCSFGCRMSWIAVQTRDTARLIDCLGLNDARSVGWSVGVSSVYSQHVALDRVFVTPPTDGWSFVVSLALPHPMDEAYEDRCGALLAKLSLEFDQANYFASMPSLGYFAWARARAGEIIRGFAMGADGTVWNRGAISADERVAVPALFAFQAVAADGLLQLPNVGEGDVLELARRWSVDPSRLDQREDLNAGVGYLASAPAEWQARLLAREAA